MLARPNKEWRSYAKGECMDTLTASLEDYLEAIWVTNLREKVVRVKDIAKFLNVKTASVVGAMKSLTQKRLVVHERYGYIQLTQQGAAVASEIYERHKTLYSFFHEILGIDAKTATEDACRMEHYINKKTAEKMVKFIKFVENCPKGEPLWLSNFHHYAKTGSRPEPCIGRERVTEQGTIPRSSKLGSLKVGSKGRVLQIGGEPSIKRRLLDMGIVPGAEVKVEKTAPFGDPIDIVVKGYHLSLRRKEASAVTVEVVE